MERNPLRVLDSKDEGDKAVVADAPLMRDYLNESSRRFFDEVIHGLELVGVPVSLNDRLVRGLDYYCHTAFEFTTTALGAQGTVLAGGRYDGLISQMGGPATPGIGWGAGIERLSMLANLAIAEQRPLTVIPMGDMDAALALTQRLRKDGFAVDLGYSGNVKKRLVRANKVKARAAIILGEEEWSRQAVAVRDLDTGIQEEVGLDVLEDRLARFR
jgi:histidyl-tRNA synthetase